MKPYAEENELMTVISFPSECERSILAGRGSPSVCLVTGHGLGDLVRSTENFLSMLEAIHYISFPDL